MAYGASMKVTLVGVTFFCNDLDWILVDYILFITANVEEVTVPNENEVSAVKYVDQVELKAMFEEPSTSTQYMWPMNLNLTG